MSTLLGRRVDDALVKEFNASVARTSSLGVSLTRGGGLRHIRFEGCGSANSSDSEGVRASGL